VRESETSSRNQHVPAWKDREDGFPGPYAKRRAIGAAKNRFTRFCWPLKYYERRRKSRKSRGGSAEAILSIAARRLEKSSFKARAYSPAGARMKS
jgi:hypothetical protein